MSIKYEIFEPSGVFFFLNVRKNRQKVVEWLQSSQKLYYLMIIEQTHSLVMN